MDNHQEIKRLADRTSEMIAANSHILGIPKLMRTHHSRELLFRPSTADTVSIKSTVSQSFCEHENVTEILSSGGGWMATNYLTTYCKKCGKIEKSGVGVNMKMLTRRHRNDIEVSDITESFKLKNSYLVGFPRPYYDEKGDRLHECYGDLIVGESKASSTISIMTRKLIAVIKGDYKVVKRFTTRGRTPSNVAYRVMMYQYSKEIVKVEKEVHLCK